jgi:hypothetical protein
MKCPKCDQGWQRGVTFCDVCGTRLAEALSGKLAIEQEKVCAQLREMVPPLGIGVCHEIEPGHFLLLHGSRLVDIQVLWLEPKLVVRSVATLTIGSRIDEQVKRFCLEKNGQFHAEALHEALSSGRRWPCWADAYYPGFPYGDFGVDPLGVVGFTHTLMAASMDPQELAASVKKVLTMADQYDEEIVRRCGGTTVRQVPIEEVLAPRVLGLFRALEARTGSQRAGKPDAAGHLEECDLCHESIGLGSASVQADGQILCPRCAAG